MTATGAAKGEQPHEPDEARRAKEAALAAYMAVYNRYLQNRAIANDVDAAKFLEHPDPERRHGS